MNRFRRIPGPVNPKAVSGGITDMEALNRPIVPTGTYIYPNTDAIYREIFDPTGWSRKVTITVGAAVVSSGPHYDFPVLITEANLPTELLTLGGTYGANSDGSDLRFTLYSDGSVPLPREIVKFSLNANPALSAVEIWVRFPTISNNQTITLWYHNSSATEPTSTSSHYSRYVWSRYWFVEHLQGTSYVDSAEGRTGTATGGVTSQSAGKISYASTLATNGVITYSEDFAPSGFYTLSCWVNFTAISTEQIVLATRQMTLGLNTTNYARFQVYDTSSQWRTAASSTNVFTTGNWNLVHGLWNGTNAYIYKNGVQIYTVAFAYTTNIMSDISIYIGVPTGWLQSPNAVIDEARIRCGTISVDQALTEYNNQNLPATFTSAGTPSSV